MVSIKRLNFHYKAILQIDINEKKWEISLANGKRSQGACPKAPFLVLYFSTFSSMTSTFLLKLLHYVTMCIIILRILRTKILITKNQKLSALGRILNLTIPTQRKKNKVFYQRTIYILSFDIDAFFR